MFDYAPVQLPELSTDIHPSFPIPSRKRTFLGVAFHPLFLPVQCLKIHYTYLDCSSDRPFSFSYLATSASRTRTSTPYVRALLRARCSYTRQDLRIGSVCLRFFASGDGHSKLGNKSSERVMRLTRAIFGLNQL